MFSFCFCSRILPPKVFGMHLEKNMSVIIAPIGSASWPGDVFCFQSNCDARVQSIINKYK